MNVLGFVFFTVDFYRRVLCCCAALNEPASSILLCLMVLTEKQKSPHSNVDSHMSSSRTMQKKMVTTNIPGLPMLLDSNYPSIDDARFDSDKPTHSLNGFYFRRKLFDLPVVNSSCRFSFLYVGLDVNYFSLISGAFVCRTAVTLPFPGAACNCAVRVV